MSTLQDRGVPLASNQVQYSLLYRAPERNGVIQACKDTNTALLAYSPLTQGLLSGVCILEPMLEEIHSHPLLVWFVGPFGLQDKMQFCQFRETQSCSQDTADVHQHMHPHCILELWDYALLNFVCVILLNAVDGVLFWQLVML